MNLTHASLWTVFVCGLLSSSTAPPMHQYESASHSLRLQLPPGWIAYETDYSVMHYRDVFLCINNIGAPSLRVEDGKIPNGLGYSPQLVADQLPVGAAYIDFANFEGPGGVAHFSGQRRDTFGTSVDPVHCDHSHSAWQTKRLTTHQFSFFKWGHSWSIFMYFREPVAPADKQAAFEVLKSMTFIDRPLTSGMRAAAAAFDSLPHAVRDSVMRADCNECFCRGIYPQWEERGPDFLVTLVAEGLGAQRRWKYLVTRDGAVSILEEGGIK